jgi:hypothetical protein
MPWLDLEGEYGQKCGVDCVETQPRIGNQEGS